MRPSLAVAGVVLGCEAEVKELRSEISGTSQTNQELRICDVIARQIQNLANPEEAGDHVTKPRMKGYIR